jgi:hypothetical protein
MGTCHITHTQNITGPAGVICALRRSKKTLLYQKLPADFKQKLVAFQQHVTGI